MNVKPGDLAIVIASEAPDAIGKVCKVLRFRGDLKYKRCSVPLPTWWVEFPSTVVTVHGIPSKKVLTPDFALRPVSGLPETEDTYLLADAMMKAREEA